MEKEIKKFIEYLTYERNFSSHTVQAYDKDLRKFDEYLLECFEGLEVEEVTHQHIRSWLADLMQSKIANSSIKRKVSSLRSYYRYLQKINRVKVNPMDKVVAPKVKKTLPKFVDAFTLDSFLNNIPVIEGDYESLRNKVILLTFYHTGIRRAELMQLKTRDVDVFQRSLKVLGKRNKERIVPYAEELNNQLKFYIKERSKLFGGDLLFVTTKGDSMSAKAVYQVVSDFLSKIPTAAKKGPHTLRHSFATNLLNNGADLNAIKELLGHANLNATQIYTQNSIENLKNIHKLTHPKSRD